MLIPINAVLTAVAAAAYAETGQVVELAVAVFCFCTFLTCLAGEVSR